VPRSNNGGNLSASTGSRDRRVDHRDVGQPGQRAQLPIAADVSRRPHDEHAAPEPIAHDRIDAREIRVERLSQSERVGLFL
jgi:hypothetical protein